MALQLPVILISAFFGLKEAGYYSLSYGILFLPASVIGVAIAQVYLGEVTVVKRNGDSRKLESLYLSIVGKLALISIPMIGAIAILAPTLFPIVFGGKWLEAGVYCIPIALLAIGNFILSPTSILEIYGYNHWKLVFDIARTLSVIGSFILARHVGLSILNTLWLYVAVMILAYLVYFIMNVKAIRNINAKVGTDDR
jgi:O-antigen/teichoic acid export membrane protein